MNFIIPPQSVVITDGAFVVPSELEIATIHPGDRVPVLQLIRDLAVRDCTARMSSHTRSASMVLLRKKEVRHPEGYELSITPDRIRIAAAHDAGIYYGLQTLRDLLAEKGRMLPCMEIRDAPDLARRAYYLDCSRGKVPTVDTLTQFAERLGHWKINELQLYVENVFTFTRHPQIGVGFSPFTPEEMTELQAFCHLHHVTLVPSLASLGHFEKILMLPEYQDLGELPGFRGFPGGTTLNPLDPRSIELVRDLYDDYLPLFTAQDVNACGDEPWELGEGRSKRRAAEVGVGRLYLDFILQLRDLCIGHGKRMNLWGDIVLKHPEIIPDLPPDLVLLNWDYDPDGSRMRRTHEFVEAGLSLVCCPGTHGWQSHGTRLQTSMRNIHQFAGIAREAGAEGFLITDWGDSGHRNTLGVSLHGAAYGAACSWNGNAVPAPDSDSFTRLFTQRTYADRSGAIASAIRTIGDDAYGSWAYHALLESVNEPRLLGKGVAKGKANIAEVELDEPTLRHMIEAADTCRTDRLAAAPTGIHGRESTFESIAREEYAVANRMNRAAARRVLIARAIRSGSRADPGEINTHRDELAEIREQLEILWLQRNRPSRLCDNLFGLDKAIDEL